MKNLLVLMLCISGAGFVACGSDDTADSPSNTDDDDDNDNGGDADDTVDCTGEVPTYDTFGEDFVGTYCSSCHAASVTGADRMSAPTDYVFDTLEQIAAKADEMASEIHTKAMPYGPSSLKPSDEERNKAVTWLKCGAK
jgi:uncharacterized membrane protein